MVGVCARRRQQRRQQVDQLRAFFDLFKPIKEAGRAQCCRLVPNHHNHVRNGRHDDALNAPLASSMQLRPTKAVISAGPGHCSYLCDVDSYE